MSSEYEKNFKEMIWKLHKFMDLSLTEIYRMTVADRRLYTSIHNKVSSEEAEKYKSGLK